MQNYPGHRALLLFRVSGKKMKYVVFFVLILLASYFVGQWMKQEKTPNEVVSYRSLCNLTKSECEFSQLEKKYKIKFIGTASPLTPFVVQLNAHDSPPDAIEISFAMKGMDMGYGYYQMDYQKSVEQPGWQAKVILPVCSLGRNDWTLKVKIMSGGIQHVTEFSFMLP